MGLKFFMRGFGQTQLYSKDSILTKIFMGSIGQTQLYSNLMRFLY